MSAIIKLDQVGIPAGVAGLARDDGLATGAVVTLTSMSHVSTFRFRLLWVGLMPSEDTTSVPTLAPSGPSSYSFTPTVGVYGSWLVELTTDEGTLAEDRSTKVFAIKQVGGIRIPAPNEKGTPDASLAKNTAQEVSRADFNQPEASGIWVNGRTVSWWREMAQLIYNFNSGSGTGWFQVRVATGSITAAVRELVQITPAGATSVITAPPAAIGGYFGVQLCGQALGKIVEIRLADTTLLFTLNVDDETIWFAYDAGGLAWRQVMYRAPDPIYSARFSPLGTWLSAGADADLTDTSGNGRTLTKGVTITPAPGAEMGRLATAYLWRYASANAAFLIAGAVSYEYLCQPVLNSATFASALAFGSGGGGSANNLQYELFIANSAGASRWQHRQQSGANVTVTLTGPVVPYGWQHVCVTRSGAQACKMYVNGALMASATLAAPDGGASGQLFWMGTSGNQAAATFQQGSVWGAELTAAQVAYLAKLRLSGRRLPA
jgi:hypothetical protein